MLALCHQGRNFDRSVLWVFVLFPFTKWPNLWRNKRKRPPLVRGHHWSPASMVFKHGIQKPVIVNLKPIVLEFETHDLYFHCGHDIYNQGFNISNYETYDKTLKIHVRNDSGFQT